MRSPDPLTRGEKCRLTRLAKDLLKWALENGREFQWRSSNVGDYEQIVVEVLLQRTTASAVAGFFDRFLEKYPGWEELASANTEELECILKPIGLWHRRARSLVGIARYAAAHDGRFPEDPKDHVNIPAVGQYVSNSIMLFQHGRSSPLLDANMARVIERFLRARKLADIRTDTWLQQAAYWLVRSDRARDINWAVLDFAALVCRPRNPLCCSCPVNSRCNYNR
jgi:A/G-specific adenine glycosylase